MEKNNIHYISWNEFLAVIKNVEKQIVGEQFDIIISVVRGGMVPSVILSHDLGIRDIDNIIIQITINDEINASKKQPIIDAYSINKNKISGKRVLVVDDIIGSGETIEIVKKMILDCNPSILKVAVCYVNQDNLDKSKYKEKIYDLVDYVGCIERGWIVLPWEYLKER